MRGLYFAVVLGACYSPAPQPGAPCAEGERCPSGLSCIDHVCVEGTSGGGRDSAPDVALDGMASDAPTDAPLSGIYFVQGAYAESATPTKTLTVALPQASSAGDVRLVFASWSSTVGVQAITDNRGGLYQEVVNPPAGPLRLAVWVAPVLTDGATTLTATWNNDASEPEVRVVEYHGANRLDPVSQARRNGGSGTMATVKLTVNAGEVIVAANTAENAATLAIGTGFVERQRTAISGHVIEDLRVTQGGTLDADTTLTVSSPWQMAAAVLRP